MNWLIISNMLQNAGRNLWDWLKKDWLYIAAILLAFFVPFYFGYSCRGVQTVTVVAPSDCASALSAWAEADAVKARAIASVEEELQQSRKTIEGMAAASAHAVQAQEAAEAPKLLGCHDKLRDYLLDAGSNAGAP